MEINVFDNDSGHYVARVFNTHNSLTASYDFAKYVDSLDIGTIVMLGVRGQGALEFNPYVYIAL